MEDSNALIDEIRLDEFSSVPLYRQLASDLHGMITSGKLPVGTPLATEKALSRDLGVSISTVRNAYGLLVSEGLVTRRPRRGSFVSSPELVHQLNGFYNFTADMHRQGNSPGTRLVSFDQLVPEEDIREKLHLAPGDEVFKIVRLRLSNESPIVLEASHVPVRVCPGLTKEDVRGSLYEAITRISEASPVEAYEIHEAIVLDKGLAKMLGRDKGDPAFRILRTTKNSRGELFEYCVSICPGDSTHYEMTLGLNDTKVSKFQA